MSKHEPERVDWAWQNRFALGKLNLVVGDPAEGKSWMTGDFMARISSGTPFPDGAPTCPGSVLHIGAEDGRRDTLRPRLDAQGADVDRVHVIDLIKDGVPAQFNIGTDLPLLEKKVRELGDVRAIIFDPITAYMSGINSFKDSEVRAMLTPLAAMAERLKVAIVAIMHLNKAAMSDIMYRVAGSIAFAALARMIWAIVPDPEDRERRLFLSLKTSCTKRGIPGLAFTIVSYPDDPARGRLIWEDGAIEVPLREIMSANAGGADKKCGPKADQTRLAATLIDEQHAGGVRVRAAAILAKAAVLHISESTMRRAATFLGVTIEKNKGTAGGWVWFYPPIEGYPPLVMTDRQWRHVRPR